MKLRGTQEKARAVVLVTGQCQKCGRAVTGTIDELEPWLLNHQGVCEGFPHVGRDVSALLGVASDARDGRAHRLAAHPNVRAEPENDRASQLHLAGKRCEAQKGPILMAATRQRLSPRQTAALDALDHRARTTHELAAKFDITPRAALGLLRLLERRGLVANTDGRWHRKETS